MNQVNLLNLEKKNTERQRIPLWLFLMVIWFSQGKGGVSAISYLMDVKGMNYYEAVKYVDKCIRDSPPVYRVNKCSKKNDGIFRLPPVSKDNKKTSRNTVIK